MIRNRPPERVFSPEETPLFLRFSLAHARRIWKNKTGRDFKGRTCPLTWCIYFGYITASDTW